MSYRTDGSFDGLTRTTNLPTTTAYTIGAWIRPRGDGGGTWESIFSLVDSSGTAWNVLYKVASGTDEVTIHANGGSTSGTSFTLADDTWYYCAMGSSGTGAGSLTGWVIELDGTAHAASVAGTSFTPAELSILNNTQWYEWSNGAVANAIIWNSKLTSGQVLRQMWSIIPTVRLSNVVSWYPLWDTTIIRDYGANGYDWTKMVGTPTTEDHPPIPWRLNFNKPSVYVVPANYFDTLAKRNNVIQYMKPFMVLTPKPDSSIDKMDRAQMLALYAFITGSNFVRSVADSVGITDTITKIVNKVVALADSTGITDTVTTAVNKVVALADSLGITDAITTSVGFVRSVADSTGITDAVTAAVGKLVSLADSVGITDALINSVGRYTTLIDSVGITDTNTNAVGFQRTIADTEGITDSLATARDLIIALADSVGITDVLTKSVGRIVALADSVGITDAIATLVKLTVSLTDSVGITDSNTNIQTYVRAVTDAVDVSDSLATAIGYVLLLSDSVGITDALTKSAGFVVSLADAVGITDVLTSLLKITVTLTDTVGITDNLSKVAQFQRTLTDTESYTDSINRIAGFFRTISDSEGITDSVTRALSVVISIADSLGITDVIDAVVTAGMKYVALADSVGITDTLSKIGTFKRTISDGVSISDVLSWSRQLVVSISDSVGITDTVVALLKIFVTLSDSVGMTDSFSVTASYRRILSENVSITDALSTARALIVSLSETLGITDVLTISRGLFVSLSSAVGITDIIGALKNVNLDRMKVYLLGIIEQITNLLGASRPTEQITLLGEVTTDSIPLEIVQTVYLLGETDAEPYVPSTPDTLNTSTAYRATITNGDLRITGNVFTEDYYAIAFSTTPKTSGKWYFEWKYVDKQSGNGAAGVVLSSLTPEDIKTAPYTNPDVHVGGTGANHSIWSRVAVDIDAGKIWVGGVEDGDFSPGADPVSGANPTDTFTPGTSVIPALFAFYNDDYYGDDADTVEINFGQSAFSHAVPTGYTEGWLI